MAATDIVRRTERSGTSAQAASAALMEGELGYISDLKKLIVGDGAKQGGYTLTPDNIVAIWPDQSNANSPLSLAWWIARAGGTAIKLRLPAGTYNVLDDLTVPANIYLEADKGAVLGITAGKTLTLNCEVGADAQLAFSGEGTAVENYVRRLFVNENLISHNQHLWNEGAITSAGELLCTEQTHDHYLHTDYTEIEPLATYTLRAYGVAVGWLTFWTADKNFISAVTPSAVQQRGSAGYTFTTPASCAYFVLTSVWYKTSTQPYRTSIQELGWRHRYKLEKGPVATAFSLSARDTQEPAYIQPNERPKNNAEAARQLVSCAESYLGRGWVYGGGFYTNDANTAAGPPYADLFDENSVKRIDCSTLMHLAIGGINYFQSKYYNSTYLWRATKYYDWGKYPDHYALCGLVLWCHKNGWEIDPGINYSKLQAGDLIFWGDDTLDVDNIFAHMFRNVTHVGMYTGRWVADPDRNNELHPQTIEISQNSPVVVNNFVDRHDNDGSTIQIKMFVRIPLESPYTEYDSEQTTNSVIYSSYYKPSVYAIGNGQPLKIDIYGRNYAVWEVGNISPDSGAEIAATNRIRSGYVPVGCNFKNTAALTEAGYQNVAFYFYGANGNYLDRVLTNGAKYSRLTFKKTDESDISVADLAAFNQITAIQKSGRDTITNGKYPPGFHNYAYLATTIPSGARLDRRNGKYAYTTDDITWTELPEADQAKLFALRIGDGENNIYIPHGQHVKLMRQAMD